MSYKKFGSNSFLKEVKAIKWYQVYKCDTVGQAVTVFTKLLCTILYRDDTAPVKTYQHIFTMLHGLLMKLKHLWLTETRPWQELDKVGTIANTMKNRCTRLLRNEKHK